MFISTFFSLPGNQTVGYYLLALTAVSGELPADQIERLPGGDYYKANVIKALKQKRLLHTYYRDGLRGFRLTAKARELLAKMYPERFETVLTGAAETNHIKSELSRRLRLRRIAETTVTMMNAGVRIYRDEKPDLLSSDREETNGLSVDAPAFYNSREIKEIGTVFVKIKGARSVGVLLTEDTVFVTYNLGNALMKWQYRAEMRTKALMQTVLCRERLPQQYPPEAVKGLLLGNDMTLAYDILAGEGGKQYFLLDGSYEHFYYLTNDCRGEQILRLMCSAKLCEKMDTILLTDLADKDEGMPIEHDGIDKKGHPVLFAYTCDLPRIRRFDTALRLQNKAGVLICFDFQKDALCRYCGKQIEFETIDFEKWERRFFP